MLSIVTCFVFIILAAYLLLRNFHAPFVLIFCGLAMMALSVLFGIQPEDTQPSGHYIADLIYLIRHSFSAKTVETGLMIMVIGGYVAYMDYIGASKTLVYLAMKPLSVFKKNPYLAASFVIPLGHLLSIPIPSATGLGLLLVASVFPVLVELGVSRLSAVSVIVSTTIFDMGPASANTILAAELIEKSSVSYFIDDQFPKSLPLIMFSAIVYFFVNRYYDKKLSSDSPDKHVWNLKKEKPAIFGVLPVLPIVLLLLFSEYFQFFDSSLNFSTTTTMFISLMTAVIFEIVHKRDIYRVSESLKIFWAGMGKVFSAVVTLIIAAELFSDGLISLGFISFLVSMSSDLGMEAMGIAIVMTVLILGASALMGSGNASFYSFGPLVPDIATKMGTDASMIILPMQLSASMGRAISPISGVVIATAEIAGVTPLQIVRRNFIPVILTFLALIILSI
jgi:DcuC family C4-dicarboxylate transporter